MKWKFETWFRVYVFALVLMLFWSVWQAMAQTQPGVELVEPQKGMRFDPGATITVSARVSPSLGEVRSLEFLRNGQVLGVVSNAPYMIAWTNASAGTYVLVARALPANGSSVESDPVPIRVYSALLTFGLHRVPALEKNKVFGIPLWQYCASLLYIFLAFYISKFLDHLTRVRLKKWAEKTASQFDDLLLDLLSGPIKIISFVIFLRIGLEVFSWPEIVQRFLTKGFAVVVAFSVTYMLLKFVDLLMGYWKTRTTSETDAAFDAQLFPIIRKTLKVFIVVVAALVTLDNIGVNITAAIASLSIGGLAVGLAAQDTLANLFGAVSVFVDKPFRVGDRVKLDNTIDGTVESIGLRSTRVRNLDGHLITVPNKTMGNAAITNITRRPNIKTVMNIGVTYDTPVAKVQRALAILNEVYRGHEKTADVWISFNQFAESSLNILVIHWWNSTVYKDYLEGMQEMNLRIKERFDAEKISFAFPTRTLYVKQDSDWRIGQQAPPAESAGGSAPAAKN